MPENTRASSGTTTVNTTSGLVSRGGQFTEQPRLPAEASVTLQLTKPAGTSLEDARALAVRLMAAHNIVASGWKFDFDRAESRLGQTNYKTRTITMSRPYVLAADTDSLTQTMLHEIAHVHAGAGHGHGPVWKRAGAAIGYYGGRSADNPHARNKDEQALAAAQFAAKSVEQVTSGRLLPGERVQTLTGKYTGLLVSVARVRATILCDQTGDQVLIQLSSLYREGSAPTAPTPSISAARPATAKMRVGDRMYTLSGRRGKVTKVGRTRYHFTCDDGEMWSAPVSSCASAE